MARAMYQYLADLTAVIPAAARKGFLMLLALTVVGAALELLGIGLLIPVISSVFSEQDATQKLLADFVPAAFQSEKYQATVPLALCAFAFCAKNAYLSWQAAVEAKLLFGMQADLSKRLIDNLLNKTIPGVIDKAPSNMAALFTADVPSLVSHSLLPTLTIASEAIFLGLLAAFLLWLEPQITAAIVVAGTAVGLAYVLSTGRISRTLGVRRQRLEASALQRVMQTFHGIREIILFQAGTQASDNVAGTVSGLAEVHRKYQLLSTLPRFLLETVAAIFMLAIIYISIDQGQQPRDLIIRLGLFSIAGFRLLVGTNRIIMSLQSIRFGRPSLARVVQDLRALSDLPPVAHPDSRQTQRAVSSLQFRNVTFAHAANPKRAVIRNLSFEVGAGRLTAITGPSGGGKSTLLDLIAGFRVPVSGEILADGAPVSPQDASWRSVIGYVSQNPMIFSDTIRHNIALGIDDNSICDADMESAIRGAHLGKLVASLPEGHDTLIGEGGHALSGGERQRVAVARALYRKSRILLLDEPTSALDGESESTLMATLRELVSDRIVLIATHRNSTVRLCDSTIALGKHDSN